MSCCCVAQRTAQTLKDGCLQQEGPSTLWLLVKNFFNQVIYDVAVIAGKDTVGLFISDAAYFRR